MSKAIVLNENGGPEILKLQEIEIPQPQDDEVLIKQTAIGLNLIDTYHRSGLYPLPLPAIIGSEGAGKVVSVGKNVSEFQTGDRVTYLVSLGAYCEYRTIPAKLLVKIPESISDNLAAAMMLKGCTAQYLLKQTYKVSKGDTVLVHAAAGGVGLIACQWAKHLGATVIGTVGSEEKCELVRSYGCDYPINYNEKDFVSEVHKITGPNKLPVVYDSVGQETFQKSMDCLRPKGLLVSYGNASGAPNPVDVLTLMQKGSLFLTRPTLADYTLDRKAIIDIAEDLFDVISKGVVKIEINQKYPLSDAKQAHIDIEERKTTGSTILIVD